MKKILTSLLIVACFALTTSVSLACGPDCKCGCQEGKECTCNKTIDSNTDKEESKCNCSENCKCKEKCNCSKEECNCGCQEGKKCNCGCSKKGCKIKTKKEKKKFKLFKKNKSEEKCNCGCED